MGVLRLLGWGGAFLAAAAPALWTWLAQRGLVFDADWLQKMHLLGGPQLPDDVWQAGTPDIPRFACIMGLAAVALGFPMAAEQRRKTLLLAGVIPAFCSSSGMR